MWHGRIAVNRETVAEVVGIIEQAERRFSPAGNLGVYAEAAGRRVCETAHSFFVVSLVAAGRDGKNSRDGAAIVSQEEHLPIEIDFDVTMTRSFYCRRSRAHDRVKLFASELAIDRATFPLLKASHSLARVV